jgi:acetyl esterase/lipase
LAPAAIIAAEIDPLLDEGNAYADKLAAAGVSAHYKRYPGVKHEVFGMGTILDSARGAEVVAGGRATARIYSLTLAKVGASQGLGEVRYAARKGPATQVANNMALFSHAEFLLNQSEPLPFPVYFNCIRCLSRQSQLR